MVTKQASFLLIAMRQRMLGVPDAYARRILRLTEVNEARQILKEMMIGLLNEIKDLPQAVIDPRWLKKLEEKDDAA